MNRICTGLIVALIGFSGAAAAAEYLYRDLMANTLPPPGCAAESEAVAKVTKPYHINNYSKRFCQTQGFGWYVAEVKDSGKAVCDDCTGVDAGKKQCHVEDVVVTCKRLKPGSVGLITGKR